MINIPDPNLFIEIQNFIEDQGAYVEKQLNSKILQLRIEYYIDLIVALEPDTSRKKIIKELDNLALFFKWQFFRFLLVQL